MKNLTGLLSAILIVFIIASCSDSGTGPDPEPTKFKEQQFGSWRQVSTIQANYVGKNSKPNNSTSEGDTVYADDPIGFDLQIVNDTTKNDGHFNLIFIDSTGVQAGHIKIKIEMPKNPVEGSADAFGNGLAYSTTGNPQRLITNFPRYYTCVEEALPENPVIKYFLYKDTGELIRAYFIDVNGIKETLAQVVCETN